MFKEVIANIDSDVLPPMGARVFVAVSGGPDSTLAAYLIAELADERCYDLMLMHFRHGIAPDDEAALWMAKDLAGRIDAPLLVSQVQEHSSQIRESDSLQMAMRRMRYAWFASTLTDPSHLETLVLGHNVDDQAETVLMRALKGRWLQGLAGIPAIRPLQEDGAGPLLYRPLLTISKQAIRDALDGADLPYCDDSRNYDLDFERAAMRQGLLRFAKRQLGDGVLSALANLSMQAEDLNQAEEWMLPFLLERTDANAERSPQGKAWQLNLNVELPIFFWRTLLRSLLIDLGLSTRDATLARIERLRCAEMTMGPQQLGVGILYRRVHDTLSIWRVTETSDDE